MRESNFRSVASNRAAVSITTTLYDRRALDCTADRPLVNSLNHLTYLTSSAGRVRETLCSDGGLERLVAILKSCHDDGSLSREARTLVAWKWTLAFQCLVFLGTRGSEQVRKRVVEAGVVPVISTVLDNFLIVMKRAKLQKEFGCDRHVDVSSSSGVATGNGNSAPSSGPTVPGNTFNYNDFASRAVDMDARSIMSVVSLASSVSTLSSVSTATTNNDYGSVSSVQFARIPPQDNLDIHSSASATSTSADHIRPNTERSTSANAASFAHNIIQQTVTPNILRSALPNPPLLHSPASNAVFHTHARVNAFAANHDDHGHNHPHPHAHSHAHGHGHVHAHSPLTQAQPTQIDVSNSSFVSDSDMSNNDVSFSATNNRPNVQLNWTATGTGTGSAPTTAMAANSGALGAADPAATGHPRPIATAMATVASVPAPAPVAAPAPVPTNIPDSRSPSAFSTNGPDTLRTTPGSTNNTIPRCFSDSVVVPRDEDVVWALEILAFVSKYAYLKPHLQETHLVPQLSLRDHRHADTDKLDNHLHIMQDDDFCDDDDMHHHHHNHYQNHNHNHNQVPLPLNAVKDDSMQNSKWDYDSYSFAPDADIDPEFMGQILDMFPLVERFTLKHFPREIQYWAGVVMRNSCRKDESKGGIRQCANFECGKWEEFPRQFAKCRRCKRTKYCSKDCQLKAWNLHRHWCLPPNGASASSGSSMSSRQAANNHHHHASVQQPQPAPPQQPVAIGMQRMQPPPTLPHQLPQPLAQPLTQPLTQPPAQQFPQFNQPLAQQLPRAHHH